MDNINLHTAQELEELLGKKYFYRQSTYRLAEENKISSYQINGVSYFSSEEIVMIALNRLSQRIVYRYPWLHSFPIRVKYDEKESKSIVVYGLPKDKKIRVNTETETEEDLLNKIQNIRGEVRNMTDIPVKPVHDPYGTPPLPPHERHPGPPHQREIMDALRRIEERLNRIEERIH